VAAPSSPRSVSLQLLRRTMRVLVVAQSLRVLGPAAGGVAGALLAEHPTGTPAAAGLSWNSLNLRLSTPAGLQLMLFPELGDHGAHV
jgi:hypothetical protein